MTIIYSDKIKAELEANREKMRKGEWPKPIPTLAKLEKALAERPAGDPPKA